MAMDVIEPARPPERVSHAAVHETLLAPMARILGLIRESYVVVPHEVGGVRLRISVAGTE